MTDDTPGATKPTPHHFADMNDVPEPWRALRGGRLNLAQLNRIVVRAYELGGDRQHDDGTSYFVPDFGHARDEHVAQHELIDGLWVPRVQA